MVGGQSACGAQAVEPGGARIRAQHPGAVEIDHVVPARPDRVGRVPRLVAPQLPKPGQKALAPRGVDDPARRDPPLARVVADPHLAPRPGAGNGVDPRRADDLASGLRGKRQKMLVELGAVELERRQPGQLVGADLAHLEQRAIGTVREPEAQAVLGKLNPRQVIVQAEHAVQEHGRDLDRRLADLAVELRPPLDDDDPPVGEPAPQEQRAGGTGKGAADHQDIALLDGTAGLISGIVRRHPSHLQAIRARARR